MNNHIKRHIHTKNSMWFTQSLGYVHNNWILYYSLCNSSHTCALCFNKYIVISFPMLPSFSVVQASLCKISPKYLNIDSLSFSTYSPSNNNILFPAHYIFIHRVRAQNLTSLFKNLMTTDYYNS
jgi:hypothetical protein